MGCYRKGVHPIINTNTPLLDNYRSGVYDRDIQIKKELEAMPRSIGELIKLNTTQLNEEFKLIKAKALELKIEVKPARELRNKDLKANEISRLEGLLTGQAIVEPTIETAVETAVEPTVETAVEPELYFGYYQELENIANKYYEGNFNATKNDWDFVGLREYCTRLVMQNVPFLPEFFVIVSSLRPELEMLAKNRTGNSEPNANTLSNYRSQILKLIETRVNNESINYPDNKLKITFKQFYDSVQASFNDVRKTKTETSNINLNNRSNHAIDIKAASLIIWAKGRLENLPNLSSQWQEVGIALMVLTGRRQSEIMSSAKFEAIEGKTDAVMFSGQLKRHKAESVEAYEIPILGNAACEVINGIKWLEDNKKRVICLDDSYEAQQTAAKKSHDRFSRYLSEVAKKVISDYVVVGTPDDWELADSNGKKKDRRKCHLFRQIYGQCIFPVFFEGSGRKLNQILTEVMGHSSSASSRKHAAENYDSDCFVKDIEEIKLLCCA